MATLYIVIIGPGYDSANKNHLPEADDINRAIHRLGSSGINLRISIIDSAINSSPSAIQIIKDYPAEVGTPGGPVRKYNLMITEEGKSREIRRTSLPVMFLDFSGTQTSYELMEVLDTSTIKNRWYLNLQSSPNRVSIDRLVTEWMKPETFTPESRLLYPTYDLYSGERLNDNLRGGFGGSEFREIVSRVIIMCQIIENYLRAGFHQNLILQPPEPWTLNLNIYTFSGLIRHYGLYPKAIDKDPNYELATNAQYRQILTKTLIHVCAAFITNNGIMSLETVNSHNGWYSVALWPKIRIKLQNWLNYKF